MKKALLLSLALVLILLVGCNNQTNTPNSATTTDADISDIEATTHPDSFAVTNDIESLPSAITTVAPETEPPVDPIEELMTLISSSQYTKAANHYLDKIAGNYALEIKAANAILTLCREINDEILSGTLSESEAKITLDVVDRVVTDANITIDGYEDAVTDTTASLASKAAFKAAEELVTLGNFADAIKEYRKVVPGDVNYDAAQLGITTNSATLRDAAFTKAQGLATQKKYSEALIVLRDLLVVLPEDEETVGKISVYEQTHIRTAISDAEAAFVTADDYEAALSHINGALQFYPENADLLAKREYYALFAPKRLTNQVVYEKSGSLQTPSSFTDPKGKEYRDIIMSSTNTWSDDYANVIYVLDGKYNTLTFTVFATTSGSYTADFSVRDYTAGNFDDSIYLLDGSSTLSTTTPKEFTVDVTGVELIRIHVKRGLAISGATLQRTAK